MRAGDLLIEIASPEFHKLQLDLLTTSLDASLARRRADRLESAKGDAVSVRTVLETRAQAEQFEIRAQSLKRQLAALGLLDQEIESIVSQRRVLDYLPLRATTSGRNCVSSVTLGETVVASQPLVEIHDLSSVWIEAHLPSTVAGTMPRDSRAIATILANPDIRIPATLARVGPIVNESTRTQQVWLTPQLDAKESELNHPRCMPVRSCRSRSR